MREAPESAQGAAQWREVSARLDHLVLRTDRPGECKSFYTHALGLAADESGGRLAFRIGSQKINVHDPQSRFFPLAAHPRPGSQTIWLGLKNPQETALRLRSEGFDAHTDRDGQISARDPDGNDLRLIRRPRPGICGLELETDDPGASREFYLSLPGVRTAQANAWEKGLSCLLFRQTARSGSGAAQQSRRGSCDFCLLLQGSPAKMSEDLRIRGLAILTPPGLARRNGACGPMLSLYLRDPDENLVELAVPVGGGS